MNKTPRDLIPPPEAGTSHSAKRRARHEMHYDQLTAHQRRQIWEGAACGHPANRPASESEARSITWGVDPAGWVRSAQHRAALGAEFGR